MEWLSILLEVVLTLVDVLAFAADVHAWIRGRPNRAERREARETGLPIPPRDRWNRRVIVLSGLVVILTLAWVLWKWR